MRRTHPSDRDWLKVSPEDFERMVVGLLRSLQKDLSGFSVEHRKVMSGPDGEFELDAVARFEALGAEFIVLVECKHHKHPVKREVVQVLRDKVRSLSAHKGMLFSTGGFQSGAVEYGHSQRIALIHITEGGPIFEAKGDFGGSRGPSRAYEAYLVTPSKGGGISYHFGAFREINNYLFGSETSG